MKKVLSLLTMSALAISSLFNVITVSAQEETTLHVMTWDTVQQDGVQAALDAYMEQNPEITIEFETLPAKGDMLIKLDASLEAGNAPDVFWQSFEVNNYVELGVIEPLDSYIEADGIELNNYTPIITDLYNIDGVQYGMPKDMDAWFIIYNTAIFDEHGIEYPSENWTWDEMVEKATQLKEVLDDNQYPLYYDTTLRNGYGSLIEQLGGHIITNDNGELTATNNSEAGIEAFNMLLDLQEQELVPHKVNNPDFDQISALISNNVAMAAVPSWLVPAVSQADSAEGTFAAIQFPTVNDSNTTDTNGLAYVMNAASENKEESWELIKFLTSDEGAAIQASNGTSIPANNDVKEPWAEFNGTIGNLEVIDEITSNNFLRVSTEYPQVSEALDIFQSQELPMLFNGDLSVEDAVQSLDEMIQAELDQ